METHNEDELQTSVDRVASQMRKGFLEYCILLVIAKGEVYASDIIRELKTVELIVVEGTLYPLLSRLKKDGLVQYSWSESLGGPPRKYYALTDKGKACITLLTTHWAALDSSLKKLQS